MPIYQYKCPNCGKIDEHIFKHSERPEFVKCDCLADGILPTLMKCIPSLSSFVMTGYRASNGYSISEDIQNRK